MPAARIKLQIIEKGATWTDSFIWLNDDETPVDLTDCTARMHLRTKITDPAFLLALTTENGRISIDIPTAKITMRISAADTAALTGASAAWDLEIVHPDTTVTRVVQGVVLFSDEVTR